jgi:hypothetical protein
MIGRVLAALLGAPLASLLLGAALTRCLDTDANLAVFAGGFVAITCWSMLSAGVIMQRSWLPAWLLVAATALLGCTVLLLA